MDLFATGVRERPGTFMMYFLLILSTFSLNLYILIVIILNKKLRQPIDLYFVSMAVIGMLFASVSIPCQMIYEMCGNEWDFGVSSCTIWWIFDYTISTINLINFNMIAYIRLMSIKKPTDMWASKKVQIIVFIVVIIVPLLFWATYIIITMVEYPPAANDCELDPYVQSWAVTSLIGFGLPLISLVVQNSRLIYAIVGKIKQNKVMNYPKNNQPLENPTKNVTDVTNTGQTNNNLSKHNNTNQSHLNHSSHHESHHGIVPANVNNQNKSVQHQTTKKSFKWKKERKAILSLILLQVVSVLSWLPFIIYNPLTANGTPIDFDSKISNIVFYIAYCNPFVNAIIVISTGDHYHILCHKAKDKFKITMTNIPIINNLFRNRQ